MSESERPVASTSGSAKAENEKPVELCRICKTEPATTTFGRWTPQQPACGPCAAWWDYKTDTT